jgi:eukaryotic-like serine/threonine-protein kinase
VSEGSPTERFGPYIVYEQLGIGGMAQVHRAVAADSDVQRPVALKRMLSHIAGNEDMVRSFVREARLASYLRHENVAQTYDLGRVGDTYFIVMELITGRNLREVLRHCGATTGPMPVPMALNVLNQICDALDYAHNLCDETGTPLGIIHRDVSPSNIIVSTTGVVKLIDFGIAKASAAGMQTMSGTLKGKFAYMAPEYIAGRIDARADLFAIGVIAHELLTNRPLFAGRDDIDTLTRVRDMHIDPPSKKNRLVPAEIDDIVMTALARDPERRWQHATALRSALTTLTRRLGLVASNAQLIEWLDWAFAQKRPARRSTSEPDTETDAEPITEQPAARRAVLVEDSEPSIEIEQRTIDLSLSAASQSLSQKVTLVMSEGAPSPPTKTPLGTPGYVPAQHPLPAGLVAPGERASGLVAPRPSNVPGVPQMSRPSAARPARTVLGTPAHRPSSPSQPPPIVAPVGSQPLPRPATSSQPPPLSPAAQPLLRTTTPSGYPAPMPPSFHSGPLGAPRPQRPSQISGVPSAPPGSPQAAAAEPGRAAHDRPSAPSAIPRPAPFNHLTAVILVVLAATAAAITVYIVLSRLT